MKTTLLLLFLFTRLLSADNKKPNIVFFFTDDQTSSSLGCYGNEIAQTPNIDKLASQGTRFTNAFVSQSICWASRTTILTGLTGRSFGTPKGARSDAVKELYSDILRNHGYRTGYYGKWHAKMPKGWKKKAHFDKFGEIFRRPFYKKQPDGSLRHETELIVDRGISFLKSQPKDKPFALNLWFNACHAEDQDRRPGIGHFPWPRAVDGMYDDVDFKAPRLNDPAIFESHPEFFQTTINRTRYFWRWNTPQKYQTNMRAYYRMVTGIDVAIGRFMKALEDAGLADNTIIVYSADNGYYLGNRGFAGKWSHYEESLRVPLIIMDPRVPNKQKGKVVDSMALNLDFPATFLDWAGARIPDRYQGHSLEALVSTGEAKNWRTETFHEFFSGRARNPAFEGIRNANYKYARYFDNGDYEFLHDLRKDPDELLNLAKDPEYKKVLEQMRQRTTERVKELGGPLAPLKEKKVQSTAPFPKASAYISHTQDANGFVSLFDGKNLKGWAGDSDYWTVKNGAITGTTDGSLKKSTFLSWKGSTIRNFDLRLKVKISSGGNSGIQYRAFSRPDLGLYDVSGYQCDIVPDKPAYNGMLYEEKGRGILSRSGEKVIVDHEAQPWVVGKLPLQDFQSDQWHEYRIVVKGNHHQHWIDGHQTADVIDLDSNGRSLEGILALQLHAKLKMTVQFKDIRIKHFDDDLPLLKNSNAPIPASAYSVKPLGKLPADWQPTIYGER
ncbi:sulfatase-like hydrolase/transferase [Lentisphaera marina]|uniref:sulfatase-like hydrolase/transferase n=1 Tax=Lentisphaera marina TaxID=1111041 RepID=UPI002365D449|nr:sulfatase-like hydrolase/transferase [Lentisphaera marina]MDD7985152.1 sulfatase-like hydrolase/transferase [Lentisphaera marina]